MALLDKGVLCDTTIDSLPRTRLAIHALGGEINVRKISIRERIVLQKTLSQLEPEDLDGVYRVGLRALAARLCNDDNSPMFAENELDSVTEGLLSKPAIAVDEMMDKLKGLNEVEGVSLVDLVGNSDASPKDSSSSDSPKS